MNNKKRNTWIAVGVGIALVAFFLYGQTLINLFYPQAQPQTATAMNTNIPTTGVTSEDIVVGTGAVATPGDTVTVHYVGTLTSGKVFDSSVDRGQPFSFPLGAGQVIKGWDTGVAGMKVGGERKLYIAPDYAYGANAVGPIPANSPLIFDVKLLDVQKPGAAPVQ